MQATRGEVTPEPESGLRGSNCSSDLSGSGGSGSGGAGADAARRTATPDPDERANARASAHPNSNRPGAGRMLGSRQRSPRICSNLIERAQLVPSTSGTSAGKQVGGLKRQYPHEYEPAARNSVQGPAPATADNEEEGEAEDDPPPPPPSRSEAHPNARQRSAAAAAAASGAGAGGLGAPSREKENREPGGVERAKKSSAMTAAAMHDIMGAKVPQPVGGAASFGTRRAGVAGPAAAGAVVQGRQPLGPVSAVGNVENTQGQAQVQAKGQGMPPPSEKPAKPVKTTMVSPTADDFGVSLRGRAALILLSLSLSPPRCSSSSAKSAGQSSVKPAKAVFPPSGSCAVRSCGTSKTLQQAPEPRSPCPKRSKRRWR